MKTDVKRLLDRLYNLRSSDSVVLFDIEQESKSAEETRVSAEKEKKELENLIEKLTHDASILEEQGDRLKNILKTLNQEDFSVLVERLNLDFNPEELNRKINDSLPGTIAAVANEKRDAETKLSDIDNTMENAIAKIEELSIRRDEAIENQNKLNEFFNLALSGNSNLTRDAIANLLEKFKFTKDEQREAAKLLMFPEDGLFDYEQRKDSVEKNGKSISDVFQEAKEVVEEPENNYSFLNDRINSAPEFIESTTSPVEVVETGETIELTDEIKKEEVKNLLKVCGFNINDFKTQDINEILENYNSDLISANVEYMVGLGISRSIFVDNVNFLYDKDLKIKVDTLISIGKTPTDIYLYPSILTKYNINELQETINTFKESGLDPKQMPLMAF